MKNTSWVARIRRPYSFAYALISLLSVVMTNAQAQVSVSDSGVPSYSQGIAVPPGVGGMAPKLALLYAGGGVNGPLGQGWSLQGLSMITRCPATVAVDGKRGNVKYVANDKLCLDGQRLIQTDASGAPYGFPQNNDALGKASGSYTEYRTEKDIYARIRAYGYANSDSSGASGPAFFRVWTKAGQIYDYGANPDVNPGANALIAAPGKAPMAWAVARISDTLGNFIDFKYEQRDFAWGSGPTAGGPLVGREWNIQEIQYSGNKVVFTYDDLRTDKAEAYQLGNKNVSVRRLNSITTYVNSAVNGVTPVRTTQLTYEYGSVTGRSRINKIQECAGGPASMRCLPATTFTYANGGLDTFDVSSNFTASSLASLNLISGSRGVLQGDFNGDGRTDLLIWSDTPSQNELWLSNGDGSFTKSSNFNITDQNLFKSDGCFTTIVTDINGDGLPDLLRYKGVTDRTGIVGCGSYGPILLYKNNGNGSFSQLTYSGPALNRVNVNQIANCSGPGCNPTQMTNTVGHTFYLMDVDGDGIPDLITTTAPAYTLVFANSPPFGTDPCLSQTCTAVYKGNGDGSFTAIATNLTNTSIYTDNRTNPIGGSSALVDIDGDGLIDLNSVGNFPMRVMTLKSQGNGSFDVMSTSVTCSNGIDFNGDGRGDCLVPGDTAAANVLQSTNAGSTYATVANFNLTAAGQELKGTGVGVVVLDFNGDGRQDILRWKDDATQNALYLSNGDGTFTPSGGFNLGSGAWALAATQLQKSDGTSNLVVGDFTGRGTVELLRLQTIGSTVANRLYTKNDPTPADQLVSVTGPTGLKTTLYYVPLSNSTPANGVSDASLGARYQSDVGNTTYAVPSAVELSMPMYVVATQVSDTGVGTAKVATEMAYRGLKADRNGRGLLGFREVLRQRPGADGTALTVGTQYVQSYPYIGVASNTKTYRGKLNATGSSMVLSTTANTYCDQSNSAAASTSSNCIVTAKVSKPYLYWTQDSGQDLGGNALPSSTTTNTYSGTGDPTQIAITTSGTVAGVAQTFTKTTTNAYQTDDTNCSDIKTCAWVLGRLSQASVANTVPNSLSALVSSAGNAANASAITGSGIQPPSVTGASFSPTSIASGSASTFTWSTSNASSASVSCSGAGASVTGSGLSGSISVGTSSQGTATCTVTALNTAGISATGKASLTVSNAGVAFTSTLLGLTWTFTNPNSTAQTISSLSLQFSTSGNTPDAYISGGTCAANGSVAAGAKCTVVVTAPTPSCINNNYGVAPLLITSAGSASVTWVNRTSNVDMCTDQ